MPNVAEIDPRTFRTTEHDIEPLFVNRWSPRAMSGEEVSQEEILRLLEAARWAPSSYNGQPWRFLYCRRDTEHWPAFFDLMVEFNQQWTRNAGAPWWRAALRPKKSESTLSPFVVLQAR